MPSRASKPKTRLRFEPLTPARWADLVGLFGPERGAYFGCWCMFWRVTRAEFEKLGKTGRKAAFRKLVRAGKPPGILAYDGGKPVGWCAIAPRAATPTLDRSPICKPVDDQPVWSITCFYIDPTARRQGIMSELIEAATVHAKRHGATTLEAYPRDGQGGKVSEMSAYIGVLKPFIDNGFEMVARRKPSRPVVRRQIM
ncbi:MAG: GNAT family N-acetyltransferase [Dongiaceae bacterium]